MHEIAVKTTAAKWPRNTHHYGETSELKLRRRRILSILCLVNHKSCQGETVNSSDHNNFNHCAHHTPLHVKRGFGKTTTNKKMNGEESHHPWQQIKHVKLYSGHLQA